MKSLKTTLAFGVPVDDGIEGPASSSGTLIGYVGASCEGTRGPIELDDTLDASFGRDQPAGVSSTSTLAQSRTTVLPRRVRGADGVAQPVTDQRPRFDFVQQLGAGAIGTVELARDNDIGRRVAVKRLRTEVRSEGTLLRFADEVRIVGQLEHPSIVSIYDVGRDEAGDVYLVMKHLEGETMEDVIQKLRRREPSYLARFTPEFRAHVFLRVLDAVRYAHSRGVIHRDLKPANIMIGSYGEVTVIDWGIAKPIAKRETVAPDLDAARSWLDSRDQRLLETQLGTLAGTPLYMSPEQAAGMNDSLDERSDVYALSLVFYEWLTLEHLLEGKTSLMEVLACIITQDHEPKTILRRAGAVGIPCEYAYLIARGLERNRDERIPSVAAMHEELKAILDGRVRIQCPVTFTKRATYSALHWIDRHPRLYVSIFAAASLATLSGLGWLLSSFAFGSG